MAEGDGGGRRRGRPVGNRVSGDKVNVWMQGCALVVDKIVSGEGLDERVGEEDPLEDDQHHHEGYSPGETPTMTA